MIVSEDEQWVITTQGWADRGSLWVLQTRSSEQNRIPLSDAKYLSLHTGLRGLFSVVHYFDGSRLEITAHSSSDPGKVLSRVVILSSHSSFEGDVENWKLLPHSYVAYFQRPSGADFHLFKIDPFRTSVEISHLEWYDDSFDKGYQGVIGVTEVPGTDELLFSIQRCSTLVRYDSDARKMLRRVELAGRSGNPTLRFSRDGKTLWAVDYDTLVQIDPANWRVKQCRRLQGVDPLHAEFIGELAFSRDEARCVVARPFSSDVVEVDPQTLELTHTCAMGRQPLSVAVLTDGNVFARDWKSGDLLRGTMQPLKKRWFGFGK